MAGPDIPRSGFPGAGKMASALGRGSLGANPAVTHPLGASKLLRKAGGCCQADTNVYIISDCNLVAVSEPTAAHGSTELENIQSPQGNRE